MMQLFPPKVFDEAKTNVPLIPEKDSLVMVGIESIEKEREQIRRKIEVKKTLHLNNRTIKINKIMHMASINTNLQLEKLVQLCCSSQWNRSVACSLCGTDNIFNLQNS